MSEQNITLDNILEALLLTAEEPVSPQDLQKYLKAQAHDSTQKAIGIALKNLQTRYEQSAFSLNKLASGYQFQVKSEYALFVKARLEEKPPRYSKALLETLALVAYRQPITRGEIEEIRGVATSSSIFKTLQEDRNWVRLIGHKDVPGKPGLYATTKEFLDYFGMSSLEQLPPLPEQLDFETIEKNLQEQLDEALATEQQPESA